MACTEEQIQERATAVYEDLVEAKLLIRTTHKGHRHESMPVGYHFRAYRFPFAGGDYRVYQVGNGGEWVVERVDSGRSEMKIMGRPTRRDAIIAMAKAAHGTLCDHGYTILQDSCPCCDAYGDDYR